LRRHRTHSRRSRAGTARECGGCSCEASQTVSSGPRRFSR
jgi:hypothetical protein